MFGESFFSKCQSKVKPSDSIVGTNGVKEDYILLEDEVEELMSCFSKHGLHLNGSLYLCQV